ncbi:uncharacterized protein LOC143603955 [Bidens hawaiensis]|uniref:uncharacterized protein LOC143603955 n=1 Tax=Bidens hawaiensis TaxID=980011 RepID=UPI00404A8129
MLSDSKLPLFFWGEAINASCFIQNRVIINKTKPQVNYFKTFGCPCTLLHIGAQPDPKFAENADECYFVGYVANKTVYRVYNKKTKLILESFNVDWQELNTTDARTERDWLFDYDYLFKQFRGMYTPPPPNTQVPFSLPELLLMQSIINSLSEVSLLAKPSNRIVPPVAPPPDPLPQNNQVVNSLASQFADSTDMVEVENVARLEAIRLFLSYASFMNFKVYQMDVKIAFLYGKVKNEINVKQPPGFEDPNNPNYVYHLDKALNGLHQAPRAWYVALAEHLLKNGYRRGVIYQTLFIKKVKDDQILVQVYVDDIIFGSISDKLCREFAEKFGFKVSTPYLTPIATRPVLAPDPSGIPVNQHLYRSMIGSLMYLTASRPDIMYPVYQCSRSAIFNNLSVAERDITREMCGILIDWLIEPDPKFAENADECYFVGYVANKTVYYVYNKKTNLILESFNVDWQELNTTDARTERDWLFDYDYLFKQFRDMYTPPPVKTQVPFSLPESLLMQSTINSLPEVEPKDYREAQNSWVEAMQDELLQFKKLHVWRLVKRPRNKRPIRTKRVFMNKKDDKGVTIGSKARLVVQGFSQSEGFDYDETYTHIAFLYGKVKKEINVKKPLGFEDSNHPNLVYHLDKALNGLHEAPRAWYVALAEHLLKNGYKRGIIYQTLFIKKVKDDQILVQVYVDDIIFGSISDKLCREFAEVMQNRFEMSSLGDMTFFLGLQS